MLERDYTNVRDAAAESQVISQVTLVDAGPRATEVVVSEAGNPSATVYAGEFYDVHSFAQHGVEYGRKLTLARMGRPGVETFIRTIEVSRRKERAVVS